MPLIMCLLPSQGSSVVLRVISADFELDWKQVGGTYVMFSFNSLDMPEVTSQMEDIVDMVYRTDTELRTGEGAVQIR